MNTERLLSDEQFTELYIYLTDEERFGEGPGLGRAACDHTLRYTLAWLKEQHIGDIPSNIEKIVDLGGHCDCEVLFNVTPDIWQERREEDIDGPDYLGEQEWQQFLSDLLRESERSPRERD